MVDAVDLPNRAAGDVGAGLALRDADDYHNYEDFIDNAVYNAGQLNAFVVEICTKIHQHRQG